MKEFFELLMGLLGLARALFVFCLALPLIAAGYVTGFVIRAFGVGYSMVNKHLDKIGAGAKEALEKEEP